MKTTIVSVSKKYILQSENNPNFALYLDIDFKAEKYSISKYGTGWSGSRDYQWYNTFSDTADLAYLIGDAIKFALEEIKNYKEKGKVV